MVELNVAPISAGMIANPKAGKSWPKMFRWPKVFIEKRIHLLNDSGRGASKNVSCHEPSTMSSAIFTRTKSINALHHVLSDQGRVAFGNAFALYYRVLSYANEKKP